MAFGKDFFAYTTTGGHIGQYGGNISTSVVRYVVEGSELYKAKNNYYPNKKPPIDRLSMNTMLL